MPEALIRCHRAVLCSGALLVGLGAAIDAVPQAVTRTIYVTAVNRDGLNIAGLTVADFTVKEDGKQRAVESVEPATEPMHIAILLDDGGPSLGAVRQGAGNFVERLQGKAQFSLMTTGGRPRRVVDFTTDPRVVYAALQKTVANTAPTTNFLDALVEATRALIRREATRPVIVAMVAEGEELSEVRANTVLQALQQSRAAFYYLGLGMPVTSGTAPSYQANRPADSTQSAAMQRNLVLGSGPRNSGGRSEQILQASGVVPMMLNFASELEGQYAITYRTDAAGGALTVETSRSGIRLRAPVRVGR
jgi:VWFA-related protein